jgi:ABC-type microcin C transport system permease subunit YejE
MICRERKDRLISVWLCTANTAVWLVVACFTDMYWWWLVLLMLLYSVTGLVHHVRRYDQDWGWL